MDKKYYVLKNKYLAYGLAFCNFEFKQFTNNEGRTVYSFEDTEEFQKALQTILNIRNKRK